jgi:hypothetical protein
MVMMLVGEVVLIVDGTFRTIPNVEKLLKSGSFLFPLVMVLLSPEPK